MNVSICLPRRRNWADLPRPHQQCRSGQGAPARHSSINITYHSDKTDINRTHIDGSNTRIRKLFTTKNSAWGQILSRPSTKIMQTNGIATIQLSVCHFQLCRQQLLTAKNDIRRGLRYSKPAHRQCSRPRVMAKARSWVPLW